MSTEKRINFSDLSDAGRLEWARWTERAYDRITVDTMEWSQTMRALRGASPALDLEEEILDFLEWVFVSGAFTEEGHLLLTPEAHARLFGQPDTEGSDEACRQEHTSGPVTSEAADGSNPRQAAQSEVARWMERELPRFDPNADAKAAFQRGERIEYWEETGQRWLESRTPNWSSDRKWRVAPQYVQ